MSEGNTARAESERTTYTGKRLRGAGLVAAAVLVAACGESSSAPPAPSDSPSDESVASGASNGTTGPRASNGDTDPGMPTPNSSGGVPTEGRASSHPTGGNSAATSDPSEQSEASVPAAIETRIATPGSGGLPTGLQAFRKGSASSAGLTSLKYFVRSIQVCEAMDVQGSGFQNPRGCLELYRGSESVLAADLNSDWAPLGEAARQVQDGYVDLMSESARSTLARTTTLQPGHVRSYNYGIITWALPIKVTATLDLGDGLNLYTHDGETTSELLGADNYRNYFTRSSVSLLEAPAEEAVVLLPNGGNWFKFQAPFAITQDDIDQGRDWVLDLVFNPDGIIKGYEGNYVPGNLRDVDNEGITLRGITVPMLDLVPVPHRASDAIVRESYLAHVTLDGSGFDVRLELYSLENDPNETVLGVDVKTLVTEESTQPPPDAAKIANVEPGQGGTLRFGSFNDSTLIGDFQRATAVGERRTASVACATHADRAGAEGGALLVVSTCPSAQLALEFTLLSKDRLDASSSQIPTPPESDAGPETRSTETPDGGSAESSAHEPGDAAVPAVDSDASAPSTDGGPTGDASLDASP